MKDFEKMFREDMSSSEQHIYSYLVFRQGKNENCYPSHSKVARDCKLSVSTVKRCLTSLEKKGYIRKINRRRSNGSKTSNIYICE